MFDKRFFLRENLFSFLHLLLLNSFLAIRTLYSITKLDSIKFFFNFHVLKSFNKVNIYRLKNIFFKYLNDIYIWEEIHKLSDFGLVDFSDRFIYLKRDFFNNSLLSIFLFEIYFSELDTFVRKLVYQFFSSKTLYFKDKNFSNQQIFSNLLYSPLFLSKSLFNFKSLKNLFLYKFGIIRKFYFYKTFFLTFSRKFNYKRYKDQCLVGITGSKEFSLFLKNKFSTFIRSNLKLRIERSEYYVQHQKDLIILNQRLR